MGRAVMVGSAKGGVGKTTLAVNLAVALAEMGFKTILVDSGIETDDVALHFDVPQNAPTIKNLLGAKLKSLRSFFRHESGLIVVPSSSSLTSDRLKSGQLASVLKALKEKCDFLVIDTLGGVRGAQTDGALMAADDVLVVTTSDPMSLTNAYKTVLDAQERKIVPSVVLNLHRSGFGALDWWRVRRFFSDQQVIGCVPEHSSVRRALRKSKPVLVYAPRSPASAEIRKIAYRLAGEQHTEGVPFLDRIRGLLGV